MESQTADLVIAVRKGHAPGPTIKNAPADERPVIYEPTDGGVRVGVQQGRPPDLTNPGLGRPERGTPGVSTRWVPRRTCLKSIAAESSIRSIRRRSGGSCTSFMAWR